MEDFLIVGAGLFGATFARLAKDHGMTCLVIDRRSTTGGNCADIECEGIHVGLYGPHFWHCPDDDTWNFVNRFTKFNDVRCRPKVYRDGKLYSFPINLLTLSQLWGVSNPAEAERELARRRIPINQPSNLRDFALSQVGEEIYETFIRHYTTKQWGRDPAELPASIIKRLPVRTTCDDNYYPDSHVHQGVPAHGYKAMFNAMLDGIQVELGVDYIRDRQRLDGLARRTVFTGALDELYGYELGRLEYRSLRFETERVEGDFQGNSVINYTGPEVPWTRITEWKHKYKLDLPYSYISREFPAEYDETGEAYYPIRDDLNSSIHSRYRERAISEGLILGGRNASYQYMDMNMVVAQATTMFQKVCPVTAVN